MVALRQMMADRHLADSVKFAHVRRELGIDLRPPNKSDRTGRLSVAVREPTKFSKMRRRCSWAAPKLVTDVLYGDRHDAYWVG